MLIRSLRREGSSALASHHVTNQISAGGRGGGGPLAGIHGGQPGSREDPTTPVNVGSVYASSTPVRGSQPRVAPSAMNAPLKPVASAAPSVSVRLNELAVAPSRPGSAYPSIVTETTE